MIIPLGIIDGFANVSAIRMYNVGYDFCTRRLCYMLSFCWRLVSLAIYKRSYGGDIRVRPFGATKTDSDETHEYTHNEKTSYLR